MSEYRALVCGGSRYHRKQFVFAQLDRVDVRLGLRTIIHGDAPGVDKIAGLWGRLHGKEVLPHPAPWADRGLAAGPHRNRTMYRLEKPHIVIAFPGGSGTQDMKDFAADDGCPVLETGELPLFFDTGELICRIHRRITALQRLSAGSPLLQPLLL